jgi:regulator of replication initiation timing
VRTQGSDVGLRDSAIAAISNLKKSTAFMLQDKEKSRHSEAMWRDRLAKAQSHLQAVQSQLAKERQNNSVIRSTVEERMQLTSFYYAACRVCRGHGSRKRER